MTTVHCTKKKSLRHTKKGTSLSVSVDSIGMQPAPETMDTQEKGINLIFGYMQQSRSRLGPHPYCRKMHKNEEKLLLKKLAFFQLLLILNLYFDS